MIKIQICVIKQKGNIIMIDMLPVGIQTETRKGKEKLLVLWIIQIMRELQQTMDEDKLVEKFKIELYKFRIGQEYSDEDTDIIYIKDVLKIFNKLIKNDSKI
jgi:hypothetical protein